MSELEAYPSVAQVRVPLVNSKRDRATQEELIELAKKNAPDPSVFEDHPPVFFKTESSSTRIDSHFTSMQPSSLKNYAQDAIDGIVFQDSHKYDGMIRTLGMSINGVFEDAEGAVPARTVMDFYTLPTLNATNKEFVDRVRSGLARDVSIGFNGGKTICSICGNEMFNWRKWGDDDACYHMPGVEYDIVDDSGTKVGGTRVAIGLVEDAHVGEVSTVFDGSTPAAGFIGIKARQMARDGILPPDQRTLIEARYGIQLPGGGVVVPVTADLAQKERAGMTEQTKEKAIADVIAKADHETAVRAARAEGATELRGQIIRALADGGITVEEGSDLIGEVRTLVTECARLRPLADEGKTYRKDLIDATITEGTRALGNEYEEEQERAELANLTIDGIKRRKATYKKMADALFPAGRSTTEEVNDLPAPTVISGRRNSVFAG